MANAGSTLAQNYDLAESIDPRVVAVAAPKGTIYRYIPQIGAPEILVKQDDGATTNYVVLGGGGPSGANTTLSNLTAPTNITQDLLQSSGRSIGSTLLPWFKVIANEGHFGLLRNSTDTKTVIDIDNSVLNAGGSPSNKNGPVIDWADGNVNVPSKPNDSDNPRELRLFKGAFYVSVRAPLLTANTAFQYPLNNGSSGQVLTTDGNGVTSWTTISSGANTTLSNLGTTAVNADINPSTDQAFVLGTPTLMWADGAFLNLNVGFLNWSGVGRSIDVANKALAWNSAGAFVAGASAIRWNVQGEVRFPRLQGALSSNIVIESGDAFDVVVKAPTTMGANTLFTFPPSNGTSGQVLTTNGAGVTTWTTVGGGGANTTLSNLTGPTSIPENLIPSGTKDLGTPANPWNTGYITGIFASGLSNPLSTRSINLDTGGLTIAGQEVMYWNATGIQVRPTGGGVQRTIRIERNLNYYEISIPNITADRLFRLPINGGSDGQRLATDGTGITSWTNKTVIEGGNTASRPATPFTYETYFDTTLNIPIWYNGTNWVDATGTTV